MIPESESQSFYPSGVTPEEIELFKKQIEDLDQTKAIDLSEYKYIFDDPNQVKKQTDAKYEIYINLTANILENIEGSDFPESKHIASNNYFIPVPSGQDYQEYLSSFCNYLENCMSSSAEQSTKGNTNE